MLLVEMATVTTRMPVPEEEAMTREFADSLILQEDVSKAMSAISDT